MEVPVEVVRTYCLILNIGHHLVLLETFYEPSLSRNLISLSKLYVTRYSFNLVGLVAEMLLHNVNTKPSVVKELSVFL